eukprot:TRINITY_DN61134_c0_g1_i1.p1 TRINITY_DN61134_c0_g1~~TRINITY_DN61134_c0_g1_i1.p1  ORF type:complete len:466 (+),score=77.80 TRINITY_DN61134_c0_g1_i1:52-1398(+)
MGSGASAGVAASVSSATDEEVKQALAGLSPECQAKLKAALDQSGGDVGGGAEFEAFMALMAHKGPYEGQDFGPAPDYSKKECWFHCGEDGASGAECAVDGVEKPPAADRPADCFYIHESTYYGDLWNQPLSACGDFLEWCLATGASVFNGSCRMYVPKFRQATLAAMGDQNEGRKACDTAYGDVKAAFEHFLKEHNKGRPLVLASHSQGSLYCIRLLQDYLEGGKDLLKQVVAIYPIAAWVPLSMFEGDGAVFKDVKLCKAADSVGCVISYTCETPDVATAHAAAKEQNDPKQEDWYPVPGHKCGEDWRRAIGEPIVGTNPLTWASNGMGPTEAEVWQGMLKTFYDDNITCDSGPIKDMDGLLGIMMKPGNSGLKIRGLRKAEASEFAEIADKVKVNEKSGDLELVQGPAEYSGTSFCQQSSEHMNFLAFYFNIRSNLEARVKSMQSA